MSTNRSSLPKTELPPKKNSQRISSEEASISTLEESASVSKTKISIDVPQVYKDYAHFVWKDMQRFGVRQADLFDAVQEVFLVLHKNKDNYIEGAPLSSWLHGIALRVANHFRRPAHLRRELHLSEEEYAEPSDPHTPYSELASKDDKTLLAKILAKLSPEKRSVFVMYELEQLSTDEIALQTGIPRGTVHSRLHHARKEFSLLLQQENVYSDLKGSRTSSEGGQNP